MKRYARRTALLANVLLGLGLVALTRPTPPYAGRVLYLRLSLAPYFGSSEQIQYWIDAAGGRIRYAEMVPASSNIGASVNGVPVKPSPPQWYAISLVRRSNGLCTVTSTNLLDSSERDRPIPCTGLLALRDATALKAHALALWHEYHAAAQITGRDHSAVRVPVPAGTELIPLLMENPSITPDAKLVAGTLVLDARTGQPLSLSGYSRWGGAIMTEHILSARLLPPGTLPGDFFDAPRFSLPDRAPALYRWLHDALPWHP